MRNDEHRSSFFETSDLPLAVTLLTLGIPLVSLDTSNPSRVIFQFQQTEETQQIVSQYWEGKLTVEPKTFLNTQRELKARIRNVVGAQSL
jgi:hypothetical protein